MKIDLKKFENKKYIVACCTLSVIIAIMIITLADMLIYFGKEEFIRTEIAKLSNVEMLNGKSIGRSF